MQKHCQIIGRQRTAEVVTLKLIATILIQAGHLRFTLHTLSDNFEIQPLCHINNGQVISSSSCAASRPLFSRVLQFFVYRQHPSKANHHPIALIEHEAH
jgi:hypothetical protein